MPKTTPIILLEIVLLLGTGDRSLLQAQEPMLFGTWEQQCDCEKGLYVDRLRLEADGTFSWISTFTGSLDALMGGGEEGAAKEEADEGGYTFVYGDGTFTTLQMKRAWRRSPPGSESSLWRSLARRKSGC